jgi:Spy/CpxP family protein refolding chaperone
MKRTTFALLAGALMVAGLQTSVLAQPLAGLKDRLGLSDEQVTRLERLRTDHQTAAEKARAELIKAEADVLSLRVNPDRDLKALEAAIKKVGDLRTAQQIAALRNQEACLQVLTPEQRQKLKALQGTGNRPMGGRALMGGRMGGRALIGGRLGGRALTGGRLGGRNRPMINRRPGRNIPPMAGQGMGLGMGQGMGAGMRGMMQGQGWQPGQLLRQFMGRRMNRPATTPPPAIPPLD